MFFFLLSLNGTMASGLEILSLYYNISKNDLYLFLIIPGSVKINVLLHTYTKVETRFKWHNEAFKYIYIYQTLFYNHNVNKCDL